MVYLDRLFLFRERVEMEEIVLVGFFLFYVEMKGICLGEVKGRKGKLVRRWLGVWCYVFWKEE